MPYPYRWDPQRCTGRQYKDWFYTDLQVCRLTLCWQVWMFPHKSKCFPSIISSHRGSQFSKLNECKLAKLLSVPHTHLDATVPVQHWWIECTTAKQMDAPATVLQCFTHGCYVPMLHTFGCYRAVLQGFTAAHMDASQKIVTLCAATSPCFLLIWKASHQNPISSGRCQ